MKTNEPKFVQELDAIYARTIENEANDKERALIAKHMTMIGSRCAKMLENEMLSAEKKMRIRKIQQMSDDECAALRKGYDVLTHWGLMRDMMQSIGK